MSEYWVSQAKYYCKFCNCHIADNKASRQHHDNGIKHKIRVEEFLKRKRIEKLHGLRSENELQRTLADIEKAANEAIASDKQQGFVNSTYKPNSMTVKGGNYQNYNRKSVPDTAEKNDELQADDTTLYRVKDQYYLPGKGHEDLITNDIFCEIFNEALDEWMPGVIVSKNETPIPNTALFIRTYNVHYEINQTEDEDKEKKKEIITDKPNKEMEVKLDRIRFYADANGNVIRNKEILARFLKTGSLDQALKPVDVNTGVGAWTTVTVREVTKEDEVKEEEDHQKALTQIFEESKKSRLDKLKEGIEHSEEDGLSTYDPYRTNIYKGFVIESDQPNLLVNEMGTMNQGTFIPFKKKKLLETDTNDEKPKFQKIRQFRRKDL